MACRVVLFPVQHTPTPNRRYHTREIDVKPDKTKKLLISRSFRKMDQKCNLLIQALGFDLQDNDGDTNSV